MEMKKNILLLFLVLTALSPVFSDVDENEEAIAREPGDYGNTPILIFMMIFIVTALILMLRFATDHMKTKNKQHPRS
jgi:hypothetical protein